MSASCRTAASTGPIVRASWFFQNFSEGAFVDMVLAGLITLPVGDVREPFVDADDIADVAVAALTEPGHAGEVYEVTGPRLMTFDDRRPRAVGATAESAIVPQSPTTPSSTASATPARRRRSSG